MVSRISGLGFGVWKIWVIIWIIALTPTKVAPEILNPHRPSF